MKMSTLGVILLLGLVTLSVGHKKTKSKSTSEESVEEVCPVPHPLTPELPEFAPCDCAEIYTQCVAEDGAAPPSGVYTIFIGYPVTPVKVFCDMVEDGGGWTVFQNRFDGRVDFQRQWTEYVEGFGDPMGEYWLGLYYMHWLTNKQPQELCITLTGRGETRSGQYSTFSIGGPATSYALTVSGFDGSDLGDSLTEHSGHSFSTRDNDNDSYGDNCALVFKGGWWYHQCHQSNLNGNYLGGDHTGCCFAEGMEWRYWGNQDTGWYYSYLASTMKFRPANF